MSNFLKKLYCVLSWVIVLQLSMGSTLMVLAAGEKETPAIVESPNSVEAVVAAAENGQAPQPSDIDYVTRQYRLDFRATEDRDGDPVDQIITERHLADISVGIQPVNVLDFSKEIKFVTMPVQRDLMIVHSALDDKGRMRPTTAHVFKGIDVTSNVVGSENFIFFATPEGLRLVLGLQARGTPDGQAGLFVSPLVAPVVVPINRDGAKITKVELLSRASEPSAMNGVTDGRVFMGDLRLTLQVGTQTIQEYIPMNEYVMALASRLAGWLAYLQMVDPDMQLMGVVEKIATKNAADLKRFQEQQLKVLGDGKQNDLLEAAVRSMKLTGLSRVLGRLLDQDEAGRNSFEKLLEEPRDVFSADPSEDAPWSRDYNVIEKGRASDALAVSAHKIDPWNKRSWRQILVDDFRGNDSTVARAAEYEKRLFTKIAGRFIGGFRKHATPKRLVVAAALLAGYKVFPGEAQAVGEWAAGTASSIMRWSAETPVLKVVGEPVMQSIDYFKQNWAWLRWSVGVGITLSFQPLSYLAAKVASIGKGWTSAQALFNYGIRFYAKLAWPVQKAFWDLLRQKNVYNALEKGASPLDPRIYNLPWDSGTKIAERTEKLNWSIKDEAVRASRAMMVAAAVVAKRTNIDIASLLMAGDGVKFEEFTELLSSAHNNGRWVELTEIASKQLAALTDHGVGTIDPADEKLIGQYKEAFDRIAGRFQDMMQRRDTMAFKIHDTLRTLWKRSAQVMSQKVLTFVFFGLQGYQLHKRFKNAVVDEKTTAIANEAYYIDYPLSLVLYGLSSAQAFGEVMTMSTNGSRITADQLAQIFIWTAQGAVDPLSGAAIAGLVNDSAPLANELYADYRVREQTPKEAAKVIAAAALDPSAASFFGMHAKYMQNVVEGFQVRFTADYLTRLLGVYLMLRAQGKSIPIDQLLTSVALISTYFNIAKITPRPDAVGYVTVWPYGQLMSRYMKDEAGRNKGRLQEADAKIEAGLRLNDPKLWREGVDAILAMYREDGHALPETLAVAPEEYTPERAEFLHDYSMKNVPVPTKDSSAISAGLNWGMVISSTALFTGVSALVYSAGFNPTHDLPTAAAWFGASWLGLKVLQPISKNVLAVGRSLGADAVAKVKGVFAKCESFLRRKKTE